MGPWAQMDTSSRKIRKDLRELLQGMPNGGSIVSDIVRSAAMVLQELMEQEVTELRHWLEVSTSFGQQLDIAFFTPLYFR